MKTGKKLTAFNIAALLVFFAIAGYSQDKLITKTKTINKEYSKTINIIDIWNAFGNIEISKWDKPELKVTVTVKVLAWNDDDATRFIEKISPEFKIEGEKTEECLFSSTTNFSNIKNLCNCKEDGIVYAPWFKKNAKVKQYSINYVVKLPASVNNIYIANNFGNVTMPDFTGDLKMFLRNVNLKTGKLILNKDNSIINIKYGKATIELLKNAKFYSYSCKEININSLNNIISDTRFSNIKISDARNIQITSKNDDITIEKLQSLEGTGNFTDISINTLYKSFTFNNKSGTVNIERTDPEFETISLDGRYNDYVLSLNGLDYTLNADLEFTDLESSDDIYPVHKREALISGQATFEKKIGNKNTGSKVSLKCSNCNVKLK